MTEAKFGANGAFFSELTEEQLRRETSGNDLRACVSCLFGVCLALAALAYFTDAAQLETGKLSLQLALLGTAVLSICAGAVTFGQLRSENLSAPQEEAIDEPDTVTGFGAAVLLGLFAFIALAAYLGEANYRDFRIPEVFGLGALFALAGGFLLLNIAPRMTALSGVSLLLGALRWSTSWLDPLGRRLSVVDRALIHMVAPTVGATLVSPYLRYFIFLSHVAAGSLFTWYCAAPIGIAGAAWAIVTVFAVARRWSWTESQRQRLLAKPDEERRRGLEKLEDLRDEAIWGLVLLLVVLPLGMRQFYLAAMEPDDFLFQGSVQDDPTAWMGFFGVELVKALPFVDWADIYGAHGATRISANSPLALHAVFAARVVIDVFFLGALLQAISISVGLARHKREFFLRKADVLDERIEKHELRRLVQKRNGSWAPFGEVEPFEHYDDKRLGRLRLDAKQGSRLEAAIFRILEKKGQNFAPLGEQLLGVAAEKRPDRKAIDAALQLVEASGHLDLEYLAGAREILNWKRWLELQRIRIAQLILKVHPSPERDEAIMATLVGKDADSLSNIRLLMIDPLARIAKDNEKAKTVIQTTATYDRSASVRKRATQALDELGFGKTSARRDGKAVAA
jgi:hypothetical protein